MRNPCLPPTWESHRSRRHHAISGYPNLAGRSRSRNRIPFVHISRPQPRRSQTVTSLKVCWNLCWVSRMTKGTLRGSPTGVNSGARHSWSPSSVVKGSPATRIPPSHSCFSVNSSSQVSNSRWSLPFETHRTWQYALTRLGRIASYLSECYAREHRVADQCIVARECARCGLTCRVLSLANERIFCSPCERLDRQLTLQRHALIRLRFLVFENNWQSAAGVA